MCRQLMSEWGRLSWMSSLVEQIKFNIFNLMRSSQNFVILCNPSASKISSKSAFPKNEKPINAGPPPAFLTVSILLVFVAVAGDDSHPIPLLSKRQDDIEVGARKKQSWSSRLRISALPPTSLFPRHFSIQSWVNHPYFRSVEVFMRLKT